MKTKNKLELTENQKKILLDVLLTELNTCNKDLERYLGETTNNVAVALESYKKEVYELFQTINNSMEEE